MARIDIRPALPHLLLGIVTVLVIGGLFTLTSVEEKKTRDVEHLQEVLGIRSALQRYYINHASYPSAQQPLEIGGNDHGCLSDNGFVPVTSQECSKKAYARTIPATTYSAYADNGSDPCQSSGGCPHFGIGVEFETNVLYPKGPHVLTDTGIK